MPLGPCVVRRLILVVVVISLVATDLLFDGGRRFGTSRANEDCGKFQSASKKRYFLVVQLGVEDVLYYSGVT